MDKIVARLWEIVNDKDLSDMTQRFALVILAEAILWDDVDKFSNAIAYIAQQVEES